VGSVEPYDGDITYFDPTNHSDVDSTLWAPGLRIVGSTPAAGQCALDQMTASEIGAWVGDCVEYRQDVVSATGSIATLVGQAEVSAIYATTVHLRGILAPMDAPTYEA